MTNTISRNAFGLGLLVGVICTLVFYVYWQLIFDYLTCESNGHCYNEDSFPTHGNRPSFANWIRYFVDPQDTLANWIIAFITLAAFGLIWRTLYLTRLTLRETAEASKAAKDTAELTEKMFLAEVAPTVVLVDGAICELKIEGGGIEFRFRIRNIGKTTAKSISGKFELMNFGGELHRMHFGIGGSADARMMDFHQSGPPIRFSYNCHHLPPGDERTFYHAVIRDRLKELHLIDFKNYSIARVSLQWKGIGGDVVEVGYQMVPDADLPIGHEDRIALMAYPSGDG